MAARTSVGSGNWGNAATWDTGVPVDGDSVTIATGHEVMFASDTSSFIRATVAYKSDGTQVGNNVARFESTGMTIEESTSNMLSSSDASSMSGAANVTVTVGQKYAVSTYGGSGSIALSGAGTGTVTTGSPVIITASTTTLTLTPTGTPTLNQVENKPYATSWIDGGSQRNIDAYTVPTAGILSASQGTVEMLVNVTANLRDTVGGTTSHVLFDHMASDNNVIQLRHDMYGNWQVYTTNAAGTISQCYVADTSIAVSGVHRFTFKWSSTELALFIDGTKVGTPVSNPYLPESLNSVVYVGGATYLSGWYACDAQISDVIISNIARSDTDLGTRGVTTPLGQDHYTTAYIPLTSTTAVSGGTAGIDQSAWATGLGGLILDGTFAVSSPVGRTYYLKMASGISITGTGTLQAGTEALPIPRGSTFTIALNGAADISTSTANFYGEYSTTFYTKVHAVCSGGQADILIDEDLGLVAGEKVVISDWAHLSTGTDDYNTYTVQSCVAEDDHYKVTLTTNMTYGRAIGEYIALLGRPITVIAGTTSPVCSSATQYVQGLYCRGRIFTTLNTVYGCGQHTSAVAGNCFAKAYYCTAVNQNGNGGGCFGSGSYGCISVCCGRGFNADYGVWKNCHMIEIGLLIPYSSNFSVAEDCVVSIWSWFVYSGYGHKFKNVNFLAAGSINAQYRNQPVNVRIESFDHNQVPGAYKSWCQGGIGVTQSTVQYNGIDTLKFILESSTKYASRDYTYYIKAGEPFTASVQCQKDFSGGSVAGLMLFESERDPLMHTQNAALATDVKADDNNTWERLTVSYTPASDMQVIVRVWAKAATGNVYFYTKELEEMLPASGRTVRRATYML